MIPAFDQSLWRRRVGDVIARLPDDKIVRSVRANMEMLVACMLEEMHPAWTPEDPDDYRPFSERSCDDVIDERFFYLQGASAARARLEMRNIMRALLALRRRLRPELG